MFEKSIITKWYSTIESTDSNINILGPQIKFRLKSSWAINVKDRKTGAATVVGLGMINSSLVNSLNRSATIWKAPFLPNRVGPILLWEKASNLRSVKMTNNVNTIVTTDKIRLSSWIVFNGAILKCKVVQQKILWRQSCTRKALSTRQRKHLVILNKSTSWLVALDSLYKYGPRTRIRAFR